MTSCELTAAITALANMIACRVTDNNALNLLALTLTQLGDTLSTIAARRQWQIGSGGNAKQAASGKACGAARQNRQ